MTLTDMTLTDIRLRLVMWILSSILDDDKQVTIVRHNDHIVKVVIENATKPQDEK